MEKTEEQKYSRDEIASKENRDKQRAEILAQKEKGEIKYDKKTPEGKQQLSQKWLEKAHLSGGQKQAILEELGLSDIDITDPKNAPIISEKVTKWQKENTKGSADGIIGWATLEQADKNIEEKEENSSQYEHTDKKGLARIAEEENGEKKEKQDKIAHTQEEDKTRQLDEIVANGSVDPELASTYGIDEATAQEYLQKKIVTQEEEKFQKILTEKPGLKKIFDTLNIFAASPAHGYIEKATEEIKKRVKGGDITIEGDWNAKLKQQYVEQVARAIMFPDKQLSKLNPSEQAQLNTGKANINYYLITSTSPSYAELIAKIQTTPEEPVAMNYKQDEKLSKRA